MGAVPRSETFLIQKKKENETGKKLNLGLCCGQICYFKLRFQSFFKVLYVSLGQIKPKAGLVHHRFSQRTKELDLFAKGQLISKCPFEVIVSTKIPTKKFDNFCPGNLKRGQIIR